MLANNQSLLERDYADFKPFYDAFGLKTGKSTDELATADDYDIYYCLKKHNSNFFNKSIVDGSLGDPEKAGEGMAGIVLIVDEVDGTRSAGRLQDSRPVGLSELIESPSSWDAPDWLTAVSAHVPCADLVDEKPSQTYLKPDKNLMCRNCRCCRIQLSIPHR